MDAAAIARLRALLAARLVGGLVVGWPLGPDGQLTTECERTAGFVRQLQSAKVGARVVHVWARAPVPLSGYTRWELVWCTGAGTGTPPSLFTPAPTLCSPHTRPLATHTRAACPHHPFLAAQILTPVLLWDERGSTAAARATLRETAPANRAGAPARRQTAIAPERRHLADGLAAAHILRGFLEWAAGTRPATG